jgi:uncharacterized membrane protein YphA (DoxX/SURF4 family)
MDIQHLRQWAADHRSEAFDLVRIFLGAALLIRGIVFVAEPAAFYGLLDVQDPAFSAMVLAHYVGLAHLMGGLLLTLGLLTRLAALLQIPVLLGAVFVVHLGEGLLASGQGLELSVLVLVLLVAYAVYGSGRLSLDHYLFNAERSAREARAADETAEHRLTEARQRGLAPGMPVSLTEPSEQPCTHGRSREHPRVMVERDYGFGRSLRFITGTTSQPKRIVFRCLDCGGVAEVSEHPEDLSYYRYHDARRGRADRGEARQPG